MATRWAPIGKSCWTILCRPALLSRPAQESRPTEYCPLTRSEYRSRERRFIDMSKTSAMDRRGGVRWLVAALVWTVLGGCSEKIELPQTYPVRGRVVYK